MKKILLALFFGLSTLALSAQDFQSAIGLRFGYPTSVTYKTFLNESNAVEVFAGFRPYSGGSWFAANGAYLIHEDLELEELPGLQWYYGAGAGVQRVGFDSQFLDDELFFSISGYLGLSYTFDDIPLNLSVDWVPTIFLGGFDGLNSFGGGYGALSARYVLSRD